MKRLLLNVILTHVFCIISYSSYSQRYEWDYYEIGFEVAGDFNVSENNGDQFSAISSDAEIFVHIEPWFDEDLNEDNIEDVILDLADDLEYNEGNEIVKNDYIEIDDFNGYYLLSVPRDYPFDYVFIALLMDIESSTNLFISIGFNEGNIEEAEDILYSFYAYD
ncbi:MAG: hypothetical protein HQ474_00700 [Flammeovirgaceae bacterium]|jgi:hypothetical protein|nr:hypothetical protein [Flammeovirgaceae bacterium]|tara:strand:+ start:9477 stop:9968 length:492 start_codon:yes stop_codon:yes gene_type:complete